MNYPVSSMTVQPSYGRGSSLIRWVVTDQYREQGVLVGRSSNGGASFDLLNVDKQPLYDVEEFLDPDIPTDTKLTDLYYRLTFESDAGEFTDGPPVAALGDMNTKQLSAAARIIAAEYERLSRGEGIRMLHFCPKTSGELNPFYSPDTMTIRGQECKSAQEQSFGMRFLGGYAAPMPTWVYMGGQKLEEQQAPDSSAITERRIVPVRMLCYPRPRLNHLLINPITDERWGVSGEVVPYLFRGVVAIAYETTLHLLDRRDTRYRLDVSPYINLFNRMDRLPS